MANSSERRNPNSPGKQSKWNVRRTLGFPEYSFLADENIYLRLRWVDCQLSSLRGCLTAGEIKEALKSLLETLDETYERIIQRIDVLHYKKAITTLMWLSYSKRPLYLNELAETAIIDPDRDDSFRHVDRLQDASLLLEVLSSLVVSSGSGRDEDGSVPTEKPPIISFAHFSVAEFLSFSRIASGKFANFHITHAESNRVILECCVHYMNFHATQNAKSNEDLDEGSAETSDWIGDATTTEPDANSDYESEGVSNDSSSEINRPWGALQEFPILEYSSTFWVHHAREIQGYDFPRADNLILELLKSNRVSDCRFQRFIPGLPHEKLPLYTTPRFWVLKKGSEIAGGWCRCQ